MDGSDVVSIARTWVGTPFHHQGRLKGIGVDCVGLLVGVAVELGINVCDKDGYPRTPDGTLEAEIKRQLIKVSTLKPGDILLMRFIRQPQHVAIYTGPTIIHAYQSAGKCVEHSIDKKWNNRIMGVFRFPGVD